VPFRGCFNPLLAAAPSWISVSRSNHLNWFSPPFPRSEVFLFSALVFIVRVQEFCLLCVDLPETKGIVRCSCLLRDFGWSGVTWFLRFLTSDQDRCDVCISSFNFAQLLSLLRALGHATQARCSADLFSCLEYRISAPGPFFVPAVRAAPFYLSRVKVLSSVPGARPKLSCPHHFSCPAFCACASLSTIWFSRFLTLPCSETRIWFAAESSPREFCIASILLFRFLRGCLQVEA
jgi:hypothetical protein